MPYPEEYPSNDGGCQHCYHQTQGIQRVRGESETWKCFCKHILIIT